MRAWQITWAFAVLGAPLWAHAPSATHRWNLDWLVMGSLGGLCLVYTLGWLRLRGRTGARHAANWRMAAFVGAMAVLLAALVSPLATVSEALSWVHMIQHMLIMAVAAPLFMLSAPGFALIWALPLRHRRTVAARIRYWETRPWRYYFLWQPISAWVIFGVVLWVWHYPVLYQGALLHPRIHDLQHICFFVASCLFWRVLFDPIGRLRLSWPVGTLYLFTTSLHATLLGVYMALSPRVWYVEYEQRTPAWGLSALQDQQLAGLIMWMPACAVYALVAAAVFYLWLSRSQGVGHCPPASQ